MLKQTIDILTSYSKSKKVCVMGNVAVARGAIEAGVNGVFAYPGTPSTEISEVFNYVNEFQNKEENQKKYPEQTSCKIYFEYSINEKIALEKAIAYSIGNKSAMCVMKNVGMNVASDALMSITYQTIISPLVIIICDDPGCFSSSNEQDSRYWGKFASVPMLNPATPSDAYEMTKEAFLLSEKLKLPVIVRMTTRVDHSRGMIFYNKIVNKKNIAHFDRLPQHINIPARTAIAHKTLLGKFDDKNFVTLNKKFNTFFLNEKKSSLGIIASGTAINYTQELLSENKNYKISLLKIGVLHPFPKEDVLKFLKKGFKKILVLEELDPIIENEIRVIAQKNKIKTEIFGKEFAELSSTGEYTLEIVRSALEQFTGILPKKKNIHKLTGVENLLANIPPRPPLLCAGCPHRATFYALKLSIPRDDGKIILCGDIGCFGLGALPPLQMIDTINHMGMSVSMAQGLSEAMQMKTSEGKIVALLGDGTFFHSGVSSLINAIYTRANITVIIFDNRTIGMTGHQDHPGATHNSKYKQIDIHQLVVGLGVECVESVNSFNLKESFSKVKKVIDYYGVSVLIAKSPCIFLPEFKETMEKKMQIVVDPDLCNNCANHSDHSFACSRCYSPKNNLSRAKAKLTAEFSISGEDQLCPANICNHGFFNSILEGDYKSAVEIVRDKMLFARTCGDICHRPCELFSKRKNVVPIKALKKFVSSFDDNFHDFSVPKSRVKNAIKKNKSIAIIGAGPAGLSAAYDLVQQGYDVSVFEKEKKAGGMVTYAIPYFRMDKKGFDYEAMQLQEMGVKFHFNTSLGKELSLEKLSSEYDAVVLAIGLNKSKTLEVIEKTIPADKRTDALSFLKAFNLKENKLKGDLTILVIGGGNSAIDSARSAKKLNPKNKIIISCIETSDTMPAFSEEVKHAAEEGIEFISDSYVETASLLEERKINISLHSFGSKKHLRNLTCDHIITAIGQITETTVTKDLPKDENSRVKSNNGFTGYRNVFIAGDVCSGNSMSVIGAIASGKKVVVSVRKLLENYKYEYEGTIALDKLNENPSAGFSSINEITDQNISEIVEKYNLYQSCYKCNHCIDNFGCPAMVKVDGKIVIDDLRCTRCGLCIDVCPNGAIRWEEQNTFTEIRQ